VNLSFRYKALDCLYKLKFKVNVKIKPRNLNSRKTSKPFLSSDTYYALCDFTIDSITDLDNLITQRKKYDMVYIQGHLVDKMKKQTEKIIPNSVNKLIIMESDTPQIAQELKTLLTIAKTIYSNNLIGKAERIFPLPLGLERQCYISAGILKDFRKPYMNKVKKRPITFLVAWNDETNSNRSIYKEMFKKSDKSLVINSRISPKVVHNLMRKTLFVPSPAGNGLDCHRTWEALYLGAIPVVLKEEYCGEENWPVLVVNSWQDLIGKNTSELNKLYEEKSLKYSEAIDFSNQILNKLVSDDG
jgi:hypothetical protein